MLSLIEGEDVAYSTSSSNLLETTNCFKKQLDKFLESVPDQPCLPHYYKSAASNSIIEQMQVMHLNPASHTTADHYNIPLQHYNIPLQHYNIPLQHYNRQRTAATCCGSGLPVTTGGTFISALSTPHK